MSVWMRKRSTGINCLRITGSNCFLVGKYRGMYVRCARLSTSRIAYERVCKRSIYEFIMSLCAYYYAFV